MTLMIHPYLPFDVIIYCLFCFFLFLFVCLFFAFFGGGRKKNHDKAKKKEGKYEERSKNQWKEDPEERLLLSASGRQLFNRGRGTNFRFSRGEW